jgi:hypothetical protein
MWYLTWWVKQTAVLMNASYRAEHGSVGIRFCGTKGAVTGKSFRTAGLEETDER